MTSSPSTLHCLYPQWPAPDRVRALCSTRQGGVSLAPYDSLNLGTHVGDDVHAVSHNRRLLQQQLGMRPVFLDQVHGVAVQSLDFQTPDALQADAATTDQLGVGCVVMVADCLPVLWCDRAGTRVAAAHAGWRGLLGSNGQGVLEATCQHFADPAEVMVWLGPCIGPQAFEVGSEVRAAFVGDDAGAAVCFAPLPHDKWLADLPALARRRLRAMGVTAIYGNDGSHSWCTVANAALFFSHRRDRVSGRLAACIGLV